MSSAPGSRFRSSPHSISDTGDAAHLGLGLALILIAAFMVVLDFSIVNVALPSIERQLGMTAATAQWVITGYAIAFGGLLILGGRAADLFGRRRMFIAGLLAFTAASLSGGLAHDPALLIASRVIQGAGAALVAPAALSLITTSIPEGHRRTRALGMYGATASIGFVAGQVLGGILVQFTSWRAVFLVNVPVGLIAALIAPRLLASSRGVATVHKLDIRGAALITSAMAAVVFAVSEANVAGWLSPLILGAFIVFAAGTCAFVVAERRHADPLIPAALIRRPALRTAGSLNLLLGLWNGGEMLVLSLYLQQVLKDSPLATGLVIAPQGVIGFTAGAFGARLARRIGICRALVLTGIMAAGGFAILTQLPASGHYSPVFAAVMLVGFGTAGTAFGTMVIATTGVPGAEQGIVGGVINTSRQIGAALGAALLPAISAAVSHDAVTATARGTRVAMLAAAIAAAAAALIAWRCANVTRVRPATLTTLGPVDRPAQAQPAHAQRAQAQPAQTQPAEAQPRAAHAAPVQAMAAQPIAAQPTAAQPLEDQPAAIRVTPGHDISHALQYRPPALRHRLWDQLTVRHGPAASRPVSGGNGHPASGGPPRHDLQHRGSLRTQRS
ncbi:MAG TPA: MFS transporter [Streptosporangiaceae bacterium]|nr:MFS transporter [Streptosporangiaceae bacterium]